MEFYRSCSRVRRRLRCNSVDVAPAIPAPALPSDASDVEKRRPKTQLSCYQTGGQGAGGKAKHKNDAYVEMSKSS